MLRQADTVRPSNSSATSATITSVPRRATERTGLVARAIGVLLFVLLTQRILIALYKRLIGRLVDVALKRAKPAQNARGDRNADLPGHDDKDDRHDEFQQSRAHTASCRRHVRRRLCRLSL